MPHMRRITAQIIGIVLIKQMIFVFINEKVIRTTYPSAIWGEMEHRAFFCHTILAMFALDLP